MYIFRFSSVEEEFRNTLGKVKLRKVGGTSRIVTEMLMFGGGSVLHHQILLGLVKMVWREGCVFDDWRDAPVTI